MTKFVLKTENRTIMGKKVRKLRRQGLLPLNLFGKEIKSIALTTKVLDFKKVYQRAKTTQIVYVSVGQKEYPTLVQNIQTHPVSRVILHADLKKIDLKEKTEVEVPVEIVGDLAVVKSGEADLMVLQPAVWVECLPTKIPEKIVVDISKLEGIGSEVKIKDLVTSPEYKYLDEAEQTVVQVVEAKKEEIKAPEAVPEETEIEAPTEAASEEANKETDKAEEKPEAKEATKE